MTGTKYDQDKPRMDLIDYGHIMGMAHVLTFGASKYGAHNWRAGIEISRLLAATQRHLAAFSQCQDFDEESGLHHLHHAAVDIMMMSCMLRDMPQVDDRYYLEKPKD